MECSALMHVNAKAGIFSDEGAGGSGVIEVDVGEEDGLEIGDGDSSRMQFGAQRFERGGRAGIDDGVAAASFQESGGDRVWAAGPVKIKRGRGGHAIGIIREARGGNK